jgi:hypothetical protein
MSNCEICGGSGYLYTLDGDVKACCPTCNPEADESLSEREEHLEAEGVENRRTIAALRAELAGYAGQNTNLRNDLVQCGMAKDAAEEVALVLERDVAALCREVARLRRTLKFVTDTEEGLTQRAVDEIDLALMRPSQLSAPAFSASHNSDERLPSSDAAEVGAETTSQLSSHHHSGAADE